MDPNRLERIKKVIDQSFHELLKQLDDEKIEPEDLIKLWAKKELVIPPLQIGQFVDPSNVVYIPMDDTP